MTSGRRAKARRQADTTRQSAALQALEARRRRQILWGGVVGLVVLAAVGVGIGVAVSGSGSGSGSSTPASTGGAPKLNVGPLASLGTLQPAGSPGRDGPEGVPVPAAAPLAGTASMAGGNPVDGVQCQTSEQTLFHIHAHLTVFVDGAARQIPYGIGIPGFQTQSTSRGPFVTSGNCFYWLHTHGADGIIHIESPVQRTYTLGDFFDIWGQPLGPNQAGPAVGPVTAIYNGQHYEGDPRNIPLEAHAQIQLDVGEPLIAPVTISFPNGL